MNHLNTRLRLPNGYYSDGKPKPCRYAVVITYHHTDVIYDVCAIAKYEDNDEEVYVTRRMIEDYMVALIEV
jgi:hypothetical protein